MKVLFLFPYPPGEAPSQRFRFEQYLERLRATGIGYDLEPFWTNEDWTRLYQRRRYIRKAMGLLSGCVRRLGLLFRTSPYDFVFIHREALPLGPPVVEWLLARVLGKKIIYDFDDAIWLPNTSEENKIVSWLKWHSKVKAICRWSYRVSCGNDYLAEFARPFNASVVVNPSTIDTEGLHLLSAHDHSGADGIVRVGWTGTHSTLKYLYSLLPVFQQLEAEDPHFRLVIIADKKPSIDLPSLLYIPWQKKTEIDDLTKLDVGLMPLSDDKWSRGKCGFKALQYMALGKPALVSPVGVNKEIIEHGVNGFLCASHEEWLINIRRLIADPALRRQLGSQGRKKVVDSYSVSSNTPLFLSLFE